MKIKGKIKNAQLIIKAKMQFGEKLDYHAAVAFQSRNLPGFFKPIRVKRRKVEFTGGTAISLAQYLQGAVSGRDFLLVIGQLALAVGKIQQNRMVESMVVLNTNHVYINSTTKELRLLYVPRLKTRDVSSVSAFVENLIGTMQPADVLTSELMERFAFFLKGQDGFRPEAVGAFVGSEDISVAKMLGLRYEAGNSNSAFAAPEKPRNAASAKKQDPYYVPQEEKTTYIPKQNQSAYQPAEERTMYVGKQAQPAAEVKTMYMNNQTPPAEERTMYIGKQAQPAAEVKTMYMNNQTPPAEERTMYIGKQAQPAAEVKTMYMNNQTPPAEEPRTMYMGGQSQTQSVEERTIYIGKQNQPTAEVRTVYMGGQTPSGSPDSKTVCMEKEAAHPPKEAGGTVCRPRPKNVRFPKLIRKSTNETITINKPVFRIGKEQGFVDYRITDNKLISRRHLEIRSQGGKYLAVDLGSTNKTYVNNNVVPVDSGLALQNGDVLRLANEEFLFQV